MNMLNILSALSGTIFCLSMAGIQGAQPPEDPLTAWKQNVQIAPVSSLSGRHSIHTYYLANPESPDGRRVLFFTSTHPAGYVGEVRVLDRSSGSETVLAENVYTEDAHRAACQQWLSHGRRVAFHEVVDKTWRVVVVELATLKRVVVAENRQLGFGRPDGDLLPLYGCHWNPGAHRDLEIWNAATGELRTTARIAEVETRYGQWMQKEFGGKSCSIFFPVVSPDLQRVFFKISAGSGGDNYMSKNASHRQGMVCYDLQKAACIWQRDQWGHPSWMPDSRHIFEAGNLMFDTDRAELKYTKLAGLPNPSGSHPAVSPDGRLMVTDGESERYGGKPKEWGIFVGDMRSGQWVMLHSFDQSKGAKSWRRNNPHPVFSADGKRVYYNVGDGEFTRLFLAQSGK